MAHLSRCFSLATILNSQGFKTLIITDRESQLLRLFSHSDSIRIIHASETIKNNQFTGPSKELMYFISQDLEIIKSLKIDIVIADHRRSALIATDIKKIYNISITQASSLGSKCKLAIPNSDYGRLFLGKHFLKQDPAVNTSPVYLQDKSIPSDFMTYQMDYNIKLRRSFGDLALGNKTFITDLPELFPVDAPRWNISQYGPLLPTIDKREDDFAFNNNKKSTILIYQGSTGDYSLIDPIINNLNVKNKFNIIVLGAQSDFKLITSNAQSYDYVNFHDLFNNIDLQICNGGSISLYFSLYYKVPALIIPNNLDQKINAISFSKMPGFQYLTKEEFDIRPYLIQKIVNEMLEQKLTNFSSLSFELDKTENAIIKHCLEIDSRQSI